jgi:hypothetical protein
MADVLHLLGTKGRLELARILHSLPKSSRNSTNSPSHFLVSMLGPMIGLGRKWLRLNQGIGFGIDNSEFE